MAGVEILEYRRSKSISVADSASEEWDNDKSFRDVVRDEIRRNPYLFFGSTVERHPMVVNHKEYLKTPEKPLRDNPYLVQLGGVFEEVGGTEELFGGGVQKVGSHR